MQPVTGPVPESRVKAEPIKASENKSGLFTPVLGPLMQNRLLIALLAAVTALQLVIKATQLAAWQCPLKSTLAIACPGCGLTRAMVMFVQGHWQKAIQLHAFAPVVLGIGILFAVGSILPQKMRCRLADCLTAFERRTAISALLIASVLIYWVVRTIVAV